jgi:hypothetical protein
MPKKLADVENENKNEPVKVKPTAPAVSPEIRVKDKAEEMKAHLASQPKVSILIPLERGEKKGATQPFTINGYRFNVPKGMMTQVPEQVAQMISERFNVDLEIRGKSIENRDSDTRSALDAL